MNGASVSLDLRERVVAAIMVSDLSWQAAVRFCVAVSPTMKWVDCYQASGGAAPGKMDGHKPNKTAGGRADELRQRCRKRSCTLRRLVHELASEHALKIAIRSA